MTGKRTVCTRSVVQFRLGVGLVVGVGANLPSVVAAAPSETPLGRADAFCATENLREMR